MIARREWIAMAIVLALGIAARAWRPSTLGLNQFDEGVYAISAAKLADVEPVAPLFPRLERFAPPVYWTLVAVSYTLAGHPSDLAAVMVNVVAGSLTILVVWFVGRRWFGPAAGVAAATILALNEFHIVFSRSGLTDITFLLLFIVAVALIAVAMTRQSVGWSILAGVAVGAAWNTKYHGWFAVVASAGALVPLVWQDRRSPVRLYKPIALLVLVGIVGAVCYLPWAWYVQTSAGGYSSLAAYQRTLLSLDWFENLWTQATMQLYFDGPFSRCALPLAVGLSMYVTPPAQVGRRFFALLAVVSIASLAIGSAAASLLLGAAAVPALIRRNRYESWMLLSWAGLFFVSAPLYHPYARLLLPFTISTHLAAGVFLASAIAGTPATEERKERGYEARTLAVRLAAVAGAAVLVLAIARPGARASSWRPARSFADLAIAMKGAIPRSDQVIVIGEPALGFYLHLGGHRVVFEGIEYLKDPTKVSEPTYLVTGVYAKRAPELRDMLRGLESHLVPVGTYRPDPNDVRLIDDFPPKAARAFMTSPDGTFDISLYRLLPSSQ